MTTHAGELAALATAVCWAASAVSFEAASQRIGSLAVNGIRLALGLAFLCILGVFLHGRPLPTDAQADAWAWLGLSGLIGFVIGDLCLFRAFVLIGSRLSMLVMTLAPPATALLGWIFLGEVLTPLQLLGMSLTVGGVAWTVLERTNGALAGRPQRTAAERTRGILLGVGGALGQAGGLVLSKMGMQTYPDPFAATQIRIIAGIAGFAIVYTAIGWWPRVMAARHQPRGLGQTAVGSFFGPFLGVSLSLMAVHWTSAGIAAALMSLTPILIIPLVYFLYRERVSPRALMGTGLAVAGVVILFQ
jgi:drug/metabolite transporter (DMT)-like permease